VPQTPAPPTSTAGRVVTPEAKPPVPAVPKASKAGLWWALGGLGLALLLFGKKQKRKRTRKNPRYRYHPSYRSASSHPSYVYYSEYERRWVYTDEDERPLGTGKTKQQAYKYARERGFSPRDL
jgi:hypothetical protein